MITLKTNCEECALQKVCSYKGNAATAMRKLKNMTYGTGPNDDYSWDIMMEHKQVGICFSCPHFVKKYDVVFRKE